MIELLKAAGPIGISAIVIIALVTIFHHRPIAKSETARKNWQHRLNDDTIGTTYRSWMRGLLGWIDARLTTDAKVAQGSKARAWSRGLLNLTMLLAVAYPVLAIMGQWMLGGAGKLGSLTVIEPAILSKRFLVFGWLVTVSLLFFGRRITKTLPRLPVIILAAGLLLSGAFYFEHTLGLFAIAFASTIAFASAVAVVGTFGVSGVGAGAFTGAVTGTIAITSVGTIAGASLGTIAASGAGLIAVDKWEDRRGKTALKLLLFLGWQFLVLTTALLFSPTLSSGIAEVADVSTVILFLALFPLLNALADFASIGLTRWRLRIGIEKGGFLGWEALIDAIGAIVIFALLGMSLITYITFITPRDGIPLLDLTTFFTDLKSNPSDYGWLAFMLISTLLPTLLHLLIASLAFFTIFPPKLMGWLRKGLGHAEADGDGQLGFIAQVGLSSMIVLSIWAPWNILWYGLSANHGWPLGKVIGLFEGYYLLIT